MKKTTVGILAALAFMLITLAGFYYIWNNALDAVASVAPQKFAPVDLSGISEQAKTLTSGAENNANLPIPAPTSKLGRVNPFAGAE